MAVLTRKHQAASDNYPSGHRWYQCDTLIKMPDGDVVNCYMPKAHPGNHLCRWQDGLWECGSTCSKPRLMLLVELGGPNDVKLIEEPDFGVIWDRIVAKPCIPDFGYDTRQQFLKWDDKVKQWTL